MNKNKSGNYYLFVKKELIMMKHSQKCKIIFSLLISLTLFSYTSSLMIPINHNNDIWIKASSSDKNIYYEKINSVTYQVIINFTLTHKYSTTFTSDYYFKFSRLNDRSPNSTLTPLTPPYQQSTLLYNKIVGSKYAPQVYHDKFNNTYDIFNATLAPDESITYSQKYIITLNELSFNNLNISKIGTYDTSSYIFDLFCNKTETFYERDNATLIAVSNSIVNPSDNPYLKAKKICNWVSNYLSYDDSLNEEKGAAWAYAHKRGDCSDYSDLMITLLRIQGIPARKVTGFLVSNNPNLAPQVGETWNFYTRQINSKSSYNILGHAWVEYYLPNIGWVASDPLWNDNYDYVSKSDYLRFAFNIGAWFKLPYPPPKISYSGEFPHPCIVYYEGSEFEYNYNFKVTVLSTTIPPIELLILIVIGISSAVLIGIILIIVLRSKKRRKAIIQPEYNSNY